MTSETPAQKFLVNCRDGADNLERATIAFILAATASKTAETAVFVSAEASTLCLKGALDGLQAPGYEPLGDLVAQFRGNGGHIWLCPACVKAKQIQESDLMEGVDIAGAPRTMAFLASGAQLLA